MARLAPLALAQRRFPYRDPGAIRRVQERRIARIVEHAYQQVPHYRDQMDRLGLAPEDLRTASDLGLLPILERAQVRGEGDRLVSRNLGQAVPFNSSGRTGIPTTVVLHYKPSHSVVPGEPDLHAVETDAWVVYPFKAGG